MQDLGLRHWLLDQSRKEGRNTAALEHKNPVVRDAS